jgi:hypothetical protein
MVVRWDALDGTLVGRLESVRQALKEGGIGGGGGGGGGGVNLICLDIVDDDDAAYEEECGGCGGCRWSESTDSSEDYGYGRCAYRCAGLSSDDDGW